MANPWEVPNLEEFLFYCCPECDHKIKGLYGEICLQIQISGYEQV